MKRMISLIITLSLIMGAVIVYAGNGRNDTANKQTQNQFTDRNNDGICDHYEEGNTYRHNQHNRKNLKNNQRNERKYNEKK